MTDPLAVAVAVEALEDVRLWARNMKGRTDCTRLQFREVMAEIDDRAGGALASLRSTEPSREEKPAAWLIYATNGNIRMWTSIEELARAKAAEWGLEVTPLYAGPPSTGGGER